MMSMPSKGVHLPTDGLSGWASAARLSGEGLSAVLSGSAQVLQDQARVSAAGELADFSERLKSIEQETRDELASQDIQDWNYAWQAASQPKLTEALGELSWDARQAGQQLAEAFNARASLEAQRDHELGKIDKARAQWRQQVNNAVQAGDAQQAQEWLQAGQGIFVPQGEVPAESQAIESRAKLARWQQDLQATPLLTLGALSSAPEEALPRQQADAQQLERAKAQATRSARQEVLHHLVTCMEDESAPDADYMQQAVQAGVLSSEQAQRLQQAPDPLTLDARRNWLRRVDECTEEEEETLMLDIATAPIPPKERRNLMKRVELCRRLPARERRNLSKSLWNLYNDGVLGCPSDDAAQEHFAELQQMSLLHLEQEGSQAASQWLRGMRDLSNRWVCFSPRSTPAQV